MNGEERVRTPRWVTATMALLLSAFAGLALATAWGMPDDVDEQAYVVVGRLNLSGHDWEGELAAHIGPVSLFFHQLGLIGVPDDELLPAPTQHHFHRARTGLLPMGLLAAVLVFVWSRRLFGPVAGLVSLGLFCLNPTTIGYAGVANVDMTHAAMTILTAFCLWRFLDRPGPGRLACVGGAFALALGTKFLAVLIAPVIAVGVLARGGAAFGDGGGAARTLGRTLAACALCAATAVVVLHAAYQFRGGFPPLDPDAYASERFQGLVANPVLSLFLAPLPWPFVRGIDLLSRYDTGEGAAFLRGEFSNAHWDYYLQALLAKTPEPILLLLVVGGLAFLARFARARREERLAGLILVPCILLPFAALSFVVQRKVGIRYIVQLLPLACVAAGAVVPLLVRVWNGTAKRVGIVGLAAGALYCLAAAYAVAPNSIGYFNRIAGGQANARNWFLDSNADFGQYKEAGLTQLEREVDAPFETLRGQEGPRFGRVAVYLTDLHVDPAERGGGPHWTDGFEAIAHAQAAWWLFDVTPEGFEAVVAADDAPRRREQLAEAYWRAGRSDEARRHAAAIPAEVPSLMRTALDLDDDPATVPSAWVSLANQALVAGRAGLVELLVDRPAVPPSQVRTWLLARSLEERRRLNDAVALVRADPALESSSTNLLFLSFLLKRAGRLGEAIAVLDAHAALLEGDASAAQLRAELVELQARGAFLSLP